MDKQFDGLIHSRPMTLTNFPQYQSNYYTKDELDNIIKNLEQQIKAVDFIDENELDNALEDIDVIAPGGAPIEKGE